MLNNHIADFIKKKFNVEINDFIMNDKYFYDCLILNIQKNYIFTPINLYRLMNL